MKEAPKPMMKLMMKKKTGGFGFSKVYPPAGTFFG